MRRIFLLAIICFLALVVVTPTVARAADIGFEKYEGEDFDFYITEFQDVQYSEAGIIVNYGEAPLVIQLTGITELDENKTYLTQAILGESSMILELPFSDVNTDYSLTITKGEEILLEISRTRHVEPLPRPSDTWRILPPDTEEEPLVYTEFDLWQALSNLKLEVLAIATLVFLGGACLGAGVKGFTRFLVPWDLLSVAFYAIVVSDIVLELFPVEKAWYAPLLIGYWVGFILWHVPYIIPIKIDSESKILRTDPLVVYTTDESPRVCIQEQTNRALIRRLMGVHHELGTDGGINPDWQISVKKPYWPRIKAPAIWVQKSEVTEGEVQKGRWTLTKRRTQYALANASRMPYYLWLRSSQAFHELGSRLERSEDERVRQHLTRHAESTDVAADMITHSLEVSTHEAIRELFSAPETRIPRPRIEEHMTLREEVESTPRRDQDEEGEDPEEIEVENEHEEEAREAEKRGKRRRR